MRKFILLAVLVVVAMTTANAQEFQVIDTLGIKEYKHKLATQKVERLVDAIGKQMSKEIGSGEASYKEETNLFLNRVLSAYQAYSVALIEVDTLNYIKFENDYYLEGDTTKAGMISEFFALQSEIKAIDGNEEITHKEAVVGIEQRRKKQVRLKSLFDQIKKKEKKK